LSGAHLEEESRACIAQGFQKATHTTNGVGCGVQGAVTTLDLAAARAAHMAWLGACIPTLLPPEECCSMDPAVQVDGIQHPLLLQPALTALPTTWDAKDELPVSR